ncbi:unnamed protein product, partial [marine sediment metagenome]
EGKATKQEIFNILSDFGGIIYGYIRGDELFARLKLPNRESLFGDANEMKREIKEEVKKELKKETTVAVGDGGGSKHEESEQKESHQEKKSKSKEKKGEQSA